MAFNLNSLLTSKESRRELSIIENILKELYQNVEDKLACACLMHKDMKNIVLKYIRMEKPWLTPAEAEKQSDGLLKKSYGKYKDERGKPVKVLQRSFKRIINRQPACNCDKSSIKSTVAPARSSLCYKKLEESLVEEECNCHIICDERKRTSEILRPLERFISTNRSFKLRLKHLDPRRYGYLNTDDHDKITKSKEDIPQISKSGVIEETPSRNFKREIENASPLNMMNIAEPIAVIHKDSKKSHKSTNHVARIQHVTRGNITETSNSYEPTFIKGKQCQRTSNHIIEEEKSTSSHFKSRCFVCLVEEYIKADPRLAYCEAHCPKCISPKKKRSEEKLMVPKTSSDSTKVHKSDTERSKSKNKSTDKLRISCGLKRVSALIDGILGKQARKRQGKNDNKESLKRNFHEAGITDDSLNDDFSESMEWDFMGFDRDLSSKVDNKTSLDWRNTTDMLRKINDCHIHPIKEELMDIQKSFHRLNIKYKC